MSGICYPHVAGMFYPEDPEELTQTITRYLNQVKAHHPVPKAIISPHAGYSYSGPIAASALACLKTSSIQTVILFGPSHRFPVQGLAVTQSDFYETPLGDIPIDQDIVEKLLVLPQVQISEEAFKAPENSIETQLPFLQMALKTFKIVPLLVGFASENQVAEVMERVWDHSTTLIIVSSDLSHYYDYSTANALDRATAEAITQLAPELIDDDKACGGIGVRALLKVAKKKGLKAYCIDLRNSGDIAKSYDQVVGYGAFHFR